MMKRGLTIKSVRRGALMALSALVLSGTGAFAQDMPMSCDPEYMEALKARAIVDAQRETAQNRNLVFKPDSVLEYSCFYGAVNIMEKMSPIAIPKEYWDNAVRNALLGNVWKNFGHTYLGDRMPESGSTAEMSTFGMCDALARVWEFARCVNAIQYPDSDDYYGFKWYTENDPRAFPDEYAACAPAVEMEYLKTAFNNMETLHMLSTEPEVDDEPYKVDPVGDLTKYPIYAQASGDIACDIIEPIPTGLRIFRRQDDGSIFEYNEYICAVPGCNYVPTGEDEGACE